MPKASEQTHDLVSDVVDAFLRACWRSRRALAGSESDPPLVPRVSVCAATSQVEWSCTHGANDRQDNEEVMEQHSGVWESLSLELRPGVRLWGSVNIDLQNESEEEKRMSSRDAMVSSPVD
jgi:hypothetical protein